MVVSRTLDEALKSIAAAGGARGLKTEIDEEKGRVRVYSDECPLEIVIEPAGQGYRIELRVGQDIRECIEQMLENEVDPRDEIENIIETLIGVVDFATRKLESLGVSVEKKTRQGILDAYDAIESFLEEE